MWLVLFGKLPFQTLLLIQRCSADKRGGEKPNEIQQSKRYWRKMSLSESGEKNLEQLTIVLQMT